MNTWYLAPVRVRRIPVPPAAVAVHPGMRLPGGGLCSHAGSAASAEAPARALHRAAPCYCLQERGPAEFSQFLNCEARHICFAAIDWLEATDWAGMLISMSHLPRATCVLQAGLVRTSGAGTSSREKQNRGISSSILQRDQLNERTKLGSDGFERVSHRIACAVAS